MKRVFLTGASAGIGLATAELLVARGHEVWGTSRAVSRLPELPRLHPVALDLSERDVIAGIFAAALQEAGHFDVVINNAGSGHFGPADSISQEELARSFQVLLLAQIELMHLAIASMRAGKGGLVINVSSLASRLPVPYMAAYNAAKAALATYTASIQLELHGQNVRLVDLQPGDILTNFNEAASRQIGDNARAARTWQVVERNMQNAPGPDLVARQILNLVNTSNPPPRATVGDFFQAQLAPLIFRLLPQRTRLWGLRKYYEI